VTRIRVTSMDIITNLEKRSKPFWVMTGIILIAGIGVADFLTGYEIEFSLFCLIPISLLTWFAGRRLGVLASIVSAIVWLAADLASGHPYQNAAIYYWNTGIRLAFFLNVTFLLSALKKAFEREKELAKTDNLTGAVNARFFSELVDLEINRTLRYRHPLTVVYLDLDNFKTVNDRFGHTMGNKVLNTIVENARDHLRKTDVVARLGGDEFAFLLPETDQAAAQVIVTKIQSSLLDEMNRNNWPVTFSIGVLTCIVHIPPTSDELIKQADDLMYSVKNNGKNGIGYSVRAN
jgi:diguanylate cyclase (GGDEF)-like protein